MQDGAPSHRAKSVKNFLASNNIPLLEWPGNSPDLNPIKNAWKMLKDEVEKSRPTSIHKLKEDLVKLWVTMDASYFEKLATSMPERLRMVLKNKGNMTKY